MGARRLLGGQIRVTGTKVPRQGPGMELQQKTVCENNAEIIGLLSVLL